MAGVGGDMPSFDEIADNQDEKKEVEAIDNPMLDIKLELEEGGGGADATEQDDEDDGAPDNAPFSRGKFKRLIGEYNLPLLGGVVIAMIMANVDYDGYHDIWHTQWGDMTVFGHKLNAHFLINDIGMAFHFAIATKEIAEACLPGGSLNPPSKALNPIISTAGGIFGPVAMYFLLARVMWEMDEFPCDPELGCGPALGGDTGGHRRLSTPSPYAVLDPTTCGQAAYATCSGCNMTNATSSLDLSTQYSLAVVQHGWGIATATDIVLAWMVARRVFGNGHPAIPFLLLLAVADDAIGIIVIALFYPDAHHPVDIQYMFLVVLGIFVAYVFRRNKVGSWAMYILIPGSLSWIGFIKSSLHPALALVPIIPLLPAVRCDVWYGEWIHPDDMPEVSLFLKPKIAEQTGDYFLAAKKRLGRYSAIAFNYKILQYHLDGGSSKNESSESQWEESLTDMLSPASRAAKGLEVSKDLTSADDVRERAKTLQNILFFRHFDQKLLTELAMLTEEQSFEKDTLLYEGGDHLDTMYVVTSGTVVIETAPGVYANIFTEGDFFGEFSLFDTDDICDYPVRVITDDAKLIVIKKDKKFVNAMSPDMQEHIEHMADSFKSVLINALHKFESHENEFHCSPLYNFEHECVLAVDIMLGFFAFANAGVPVTGIGAMTLVVGGSLFLGKTIGIFLAGGFAHVFFNRWAPLPQGVTLTDLLCVSITASVGLTVALFVSAEAFTDYPSLMRDANLGALLSLLFGIVAWVVGKLVGAYAGDSNEIIGGAHEATEQMEAAERKQKALADAAMAAELAADHAVAMDEMSSLSDAQVRKVFMMVMTDFSLLVENMKPEQLAHQPSHVINTALFNTLDDIKSRVKRSGSRVSPNKADAEAAAAKDDIE